MFPYIFFVSLVSLAGGVLNVYRRFAIPAFTPVLLNVSIIARRDFSCSACRSAHSCAGVGCGDRGVAQLRFRSGRCAPRHVAAFELDWRDEGVRRVLRAMGPAVLGVSAAQISSLINTQLPPIWVTAEFPGSLRRPPDGISHRAARRRAGDHPAAQPGQASSRRQSRAVPRLLDWGLAWPSCLRCRRRWRWCCSPCH